MRSYGLIEKIKKDQYLTSCKSIAKQELSPINLNQASYSIHVYILDKIYLKIEYFLYLFTRLIIIKYLSSHSTFPILFLFFPIRNIKICQLPTIVVLAKFLQIYYFK